jgi:hypothetical protein
MNRELRKYLAKLGSKGGRASAENLSAKERTERARKAAHASAKVRQAKAKAGKGEA